MILGFIAGALAIPISTAAWGSWVDTVAARVEAVATRTVLDGCPTGSEVASVLRDLTGPWPGRAAAERAAMVQVGLSQAQVQAWNGDHPDAMATLRRRVEAAVAPVRACQPDLDPFVIDAPGIGSLTWHTDLAEARNAARGSGRSLLLFASASWAMGTAVMDQAVWRNGLATNVVARLAVPVRLEWASPSDPPVVTGLLTGYALGTEVPTLQVFDGQGRACEGLIESGYVEPDHLVTVLLMGRAKACHAG